MRVLLSDGSGLTARQCAGLLSRAGHRVDVLASGDLPLAAFTRYVHRVHRLPAYGPDPLTWWDAAVAVLDKTGPDVLLPTQEQVGVISLRLRELRGLGVGTAVPAFSALTRVQDKLAADRTLREAGLRRPHSWVATDRDQLLEGVTGPAFLKLPIGTAGTGVVRVGDRREVPDAADRFERSGAFAGDGVLVEEPVAGPLVMVQAVFDAGRLVVLHANDRTREGAGGGASSKTSRRTDDLIDDVVRLGAHLNWQGALSLDAIATADGPVWIDVNPRVVEPGAAARDGVDLLGPLLALATGSPVGPLPIPPEPIPPEPTSPRPIPGVRTHQLLLAVLGAAESGGGRVGVAKELLLAAAGRGPYANSTEELTPLSGDPLAGIPVLVSAAACLLRPEWHRPFTHGAVSNYALTSVGWQMLLDEAR